MCEQAKRARGKKPERSIFDYDQLGVYFVNLIFNEIKQLNCLQVDGGGSLSRGLRSRGPRVHGMSIYLCVVIINIGS